MNKLTTKLIAVVMLVSTAVSSLAAETTTVAPSLQLSASPAPLTAPTVLSKKVALNSADLAKYQQLADQSQGLATQQAAGASSTTKTVLIVVGVAVVVVVVVGMAAGSSNDLPAFGFSP